MVNKSKKLKAEADAYRKKYVMGGEKRPIDLEAPRPPGGYRAAAEVIVLDDDMPPVKRHKSDNDGWGPGTQIIRNVFPAPAPPVDSNTKNVAPGNKNGVLPIDFGTVSSHEQSLGILDVSGLGTSLDSKELDGIGINLALSLEVDLDLPGMVSTVVKDVEFSDFDLCLGSGAIPDDSGISLPLTPESLHNSPQDISDIPHDHDAAMTAGTAPNNSFIFQFMDHDGIAIDFDLLATPPIDNEVDQMLDDAHTNGLHDVTCGHDDELWRDTFFKLSIPKYDNVTAENMMAPAEIVISEGETVPKENDAVKPTIDTDETADKANGTTNKPQGISLVEMPTKVPSETKGHKNDGDEESPLDAELDTELFG